MFEIRSVVIDRGPIEYVDVEPAASSAGAAPLVFLHEGLGSLRRWHGFPDRLHEATGRRTIVYSRHGYGGSSVLAAPREPDYLHREAEVVLPALLERLDVRRPVLVGHSDGASIALIAAATATVEAAGIVAIAPHVVVEDRTIAGLERVREAFLHGDLAARLTPHHTDVVRTFHGWNDVWLSPAFRSWDLTDLLPGLRCAVLTVQGLDDEYGTVRQVELVEGYSPAPVVRLDLAGCGHAPHAERADEVLAAAVGFIRSYC